MSGFFLLSLLLALFFEPAEVLAPVPEGGACSVSEDAPAGLQKLVKAYPEDLCGATKDELIWKDGTRMPYETRDHSLPIDLEDRLNSADLRDQMEQPYPVGPDLPPPKPDEDPGRFRYEPFFTKLYGASQKEVAAQIEQLRWFDGKILRVHKKYHLKDRMEAIMQEIGALPKKTRESVRLSSGTFVWRKVKTAKTKNGNQTERLSAHSFAIAIDVGVANSDFWGWVKPDAEGNYPYKNRIPLEIVQIFERHGFIWGGRWAHFDTMHFEFRPELLP